MKIDGFIRNFEESIEGLEEGTIQAETIFQDLPQWDSLAVLTTLAMVDAEYEVSLSANELAELRTIDDLFKFVLGKKEG